MSRGTVCLIAPVPPHQGGIAQHAAALEKALATDGWTVDVISWYHQFPKRLYQGSQHRPPRTDRFVLGWRNPASWRRARRRVLEADLVVVPWVSAFNSWVLGYLLRGARSRTVAIVHNATPHERQPMAGALTRRFLSGMRRYVVHSSFVEKEVHRLFGPVDVRVTPLPSLLDPGPSPNPQPPMPPVRLLFVGYIRRYKGVDILLRALALLRDRGNDVTALVAGEAWGGVDDELRELRSQLGLEDTVDFRFGYTADTDLLDLIREHHAVVQPYRRASQSGIVPLALAAHRPVVVTRVGGLDEEVREGETGFVADPDDPPSLSHAIERLISGLQVGLVFPHGANWADVSAAITSDV